MKAWGKLARDGSLGASRVLADRKLIQERGEPAEYAILLLEGTAEVFQQLPSGDSVVVKVITAPTIIGSPELLANEPLYLASTRVVDSARLHWIRADRYYEILRQHPAAAFESMSDVSQAFCGAAKFEASRLFETETVLATLLSAYAELFGKPVKDGIEIQLVRSQQDLAAAVGAVERSINRVLAQWQEKEWISKRAKRYVIRKPEMLDAVAGILRGTLIHRWRAPPELLSQ
jgi:CRP-like cAMP-binding protein